MTQRPQPSPTELEFLTMFRLLCAKIGAQQAVERLLQFMQDHMHMCQDQDTEAA